MSNPKPQSFKNHTSFDPWFHIFLTLVLDVEIHLVSFLRELPGKIY